MGGLPCRTLAYKRVTLLDARELHVERASVAHDGNVKLRIVRLAPCTFRLQTSTFQHGRREPPLYFRDVLRTCEYQRWYEASER